MLENLRILAKQLSDAWFARPESERKRWRKGVRDLQADQVKTLTALQTLWDRVEVIFFTEVPDVAPYRDVFDAQRKLSLAQYGGGGAKLFTAPSNRLPV